MSRYARKADANQPEFVKAGRQIGYHFTHTHTVGNGMTDLVAYNIRECELLDFPFGINALVELKTEEAYRSKNHGLTTGERGELKWHNKYRGWVIITYDIEHFHAAYIAGLKNIVKSVKLKAGYSTIQSE